MFHIKFIQAINFKYVYTNDLFSQINKIDVSFVTFVNKIYMNLNSYLNLFEYNRVNYDKFNKKNYMYEKKADSN